VLTCLVIAGVIVATASWMEVVAVAVLLVVATVVYLLRQ
jgi:hypothetical protein